MLKTRILLIVVSVALIWLIFLLPKVVVDNDNQLGDGESQTTSQVPPKTLIQSLKTSLPPFEI